MPEKRNENKTINAQGAVLMAGASRIRNFVKSNSLGAYDLDLLELFSTLFNNEGFELRTVDRSVVCHVSPRRALPAPQSLSRNLRRHRSPSRRPARGLSLIHI